MTDHQCRRNLLLDVDNNRRQSSNQVTIGFAARKTASRKIDNGDSEIRLQKDSQQPKHNVVKPSKTYRVPKGSRSSFSYQAGLTFFISSSSIPAKSPLSRGFKLDI